MTDRTDENHQNKTSIRLTAAERRREALQLRIAGLTYREIAESVGYRSSASAHEAVTKELAAIPREAAKELRDLELQRLDDAQVSIAAQIRGGDLFAIDRLLKIIDTRAKLAGTYQMPEENDANKDVKSAFAGLMRRAAEQAAKADTDDAADVDDDE